MKKSEKLFVILLAQWLIYSPVFAQIPPPPGSGGCTNCPPFTNYITTPYVPGLKVSMTGIIGTNLQLNLLEADPAGKYDIYFASNLIDSAWSDVLQGTNGQTNFTLTMPRTDMRFFRAARTDTPIINAADMTPSFPNPWENTNLVEANITGGPAASMAVLVNSTNFSSASWMPFSAIPFVQLGTNDGVYQVWFGLQGSDGSVYWSEATVTLDTSPPLLVITNPTASTVSQPMIQLQGYSPEPLSSLTFDISNAAGAITNQSGFLVEQCYDTNLWTFTTNYFQCFDVPLTNGMNTITLHAADLAGNVTTTNFNIAVDYSDKTNPPMFTLTWPQNGDNVSGNQFSLIGQLSDWTATVTATLIDTNGATNIFSGLV